MRHFQRTSDYLAAPCPDPAYQPAFNPLPRARRAASRVLIPIGYAQLVPDALELHEQVAHLLLRIFPSRVVWTVDLQRRFSARCGCVAANEALCHKLPFWPKCRWPAVWAAWPIAHLADFRFGFLASTFSVRSPQNPKDLGFRVFSPFALRWCRPFGLKTPASCRTENHDLPVFCLQKIRLTDF